MQDKWIMMGVFAAGVCVCFVVLYAMGFSFRSTGGTQLPPPENSALRLSTGTSLSFGSMRDNAMLGAQKEQAIQGVNELQGMYRQALNEINTFEQGNPAMTSRPALPPLTNPYAGPASPPSYPVSPTYNGAANQIAISVKPTDMIIPLTRQMLPGAN